MFFDDFHPDGRRILVVGTLREPTAMLEALRADEFDVVDRLHRPVARAASRCRRSPAPPSPSAATRCSPPTPSTRPARWRCAIADGDDAILAAGSLYVAGAARPALQRLLP